MSNAATKTVTVTTGKPSTRTGQTSYEFAWDHINDDAIEFYSYYACPLLALELCSITERPFAVIEQWDHYHKQYRFLHVATQVGEQRFCDITGAHRLEEYTAGLGSSRGGRKRLAAVRGVGEMRLRIGSPAPQDGYGEADGLYATFALNPPDGRYMTRRQVALLLDTPGVQEAFMRV